MGMIGNTPYQGLIDTVNIVDGAITAAKIKAAADLVSKLGYAPVNKAGDTMTGKLTINDQGLATTQHIGFNRNIDNGALLLTGQNAWQITRYGSSHGTYPNALGLEAYNSVGSDIGVPLVFDANVGGNGKAISRKPNNPCFGAYGTNNGTVLTVGADTVLPYNTEAFDSHGDYNPSTYTFTAPVNGYYMFIAEFLCYPSALGVAQYISLWISINGSNHTGESGLSREQGIPEQTTQSVTSIRYMSKNDTAQAKVNLSGGTGSFYLNSGHAMFAGFLIG